ncbi:MAG: aminoglycoside adenylyltransferase domain-containing protein [Chloroflexota bacterium]
MNKSKLDPKLVDVMQVLAEQLEATLGDNFLALYLIGSFAMGAGDEHSDVDFLAITEHDLVNEQVKQVEAIHQAIYDTAHPYSNHLEGSYFPKSIFADRDQWYQPIWYLDNGAKQLERSAHDNEAVVFWVTREYGITIYGDPPESYIPIITGDDLHKSIQQTMISWSADILTRKWDMNNMWAQPFTVMSWCRMMQTLATNRIHSKQAGVEWGIANLNSKWHPLIEQSWQDRPNPSESPKNMFDSNQGHSG